MVAVGGILTLGAVLNGLFDRVSKVIREAQAAAGAVIFQAGGEVYLAINNAREAYKDILNDTVNTLVPAVNTIIQNLEAAASTPSR